MKPIHRIQPKALVLIAVLLFQLYLLTFGKGLFGYHGSPVFILILGLAIGLVPLRGKTQFIYTAGKVRHAWAWIIPAVGALICGMIIHDIIHTWPLDPKSSDIIPSVQHMYIDRLFAGDKIYRPYYGFGYEFQATYLPLFWMPYIISALLQLDHRWLAYAILAASLMAWHWRLSRKALPLPEYAIKSALPWAVLAVFILSNKEVVAYTLECVVAGYYVFFVLSIMARSNVKNAAGVVVTLLSRYSNLLFLPLYAWIGIRNKGWKPFALITGVVIGSVLVIYIIPFLSTNWQAFFNAYEYYSSATLYEWVRPDIGKPVHLLNGVGMAFWYYTFALGELASKVELLKYSQLLLALSIPLLLGVWYVVRRPDLHWQAFLLCAFQVYMALFYSFVQIPYA